MATLQHYMADAEVRKRAWKSRIDTFARELHPNAGHRALVDLERRGTLHTLITQNVDGLHLAAGTSAEKLVEIHGTVREVVCMRCGARGPMLATLERVRAGERDPACLDCGGILKSATISFGQPLVAEDLERAERAAWSCDVLLALGSTLSVFPVAGVVPVAKRAGAKIVIINGSATDMDDLADIAIQGALGLLLPRVVARSTS
jgi:NAD-dependent deacetylase